MLERNPTKNMGFLKWLIWKSTKPTKTSPMPQQLAHSSNWNSPPSSLQGILTTEGQRRTKYWNRKSLAAFSFSNLWKKSVDLYFLYLALPPPNWQLEKQQNCSTLFVGRSWAHQQPHSSSTHGTCQRHYRSWLPQSKRQVWRRFCPQRSMKKRNFWKHVWNICAHTVPRVRSTRVQRPVPR